MMTDEEAKREQEQTIERLSQRTRTQANLRRDAVQTKP
jgi:hypothetical protein